MGCVGLILMAVILAGFTVWLKAVISHLQRQLTRIQMEVSDLQQTRSAAEIPPEWRIVIKGRTEPMTLRAASESAVLLELLRMGINPRHIMALEPITPALHQPVTPA